MKTPPLLIGSAILFWGWQTGLLPIAVITALFVEVHHLTTWRLKLDDDGFSNVINLSNILLAATAIFSYAWQGKAGSFLTVISWFPLILLPVLLAQLYSTWGRINPDVFFIFLKKNREKKRNPTRVSIAYPYLAICILSGSMANVRSLLTYMLMAFICGWALYSVKPHKSATLTWLIIFIAAAGTGYYGSVGLHRLHQKAEEKFIEWYTGTFMESNDYQQTTTSMGKVGRRKSSGEIILRVNSEGKRRNAFHLVESSYDTFRSPSWFAVKAPVIPLKGENNKSKWILRGEGKGNKELTIFKSLQGGKNIIPLPPNAAVIENLTVNELFQNRMGTVVTEDDPLFAAYRVSNNEGENTMDSPTPADLAIPKDYASLINELAHNMNLNSKKGDEAINSLTGFFLSDFTYSLDPESNEESALPLKDFLIKTKSGHCEYFATATTLLLRSAGIPARYRVGYLVHEYSGLEDMYVVRERDAHAWVTAYIDGRWQTVDTTPPSWVSSDSQSASFMEPLSDLRSWLQFVVAKWRASGENIFIKYWYILLLLLLLLLWRLFGKEDISLVHRKKEERGGEGDSRPQSPFYEVEKEMTSLGYRRFEWESYPVWIERLTGEGVSTTACPSLNKALALHLRMRFDPSGISGSEKNEMEKLVQEWLTESLPLLAQENVNKGVTNEMP